VDQNEIAFNCDNLNKHNCKTILVKGFEDYGYQIKISWLKEEIETELLTVWYRKHIDVYSSDFFESDDVRQRVVDNEVEHLLVRYKQIKKLLGEDYRIFYYQTPKEYWKDFRWQEGIVFIQGCEVIAEIVLTQS